MLLGSLYVSSIFLHITKKCFIFSSVIYILNLLNIMSEKLKSDHLCNILKTLTLASKHSY